MGKNDESFEGESRRGTVRKPVALMLVICMGAAAYLGYCGVVGYLEHRAGTQYYGALAGEAHAPAVTVQPSAALSAQPTAGSAEPTAEAPEPTREPAAQGAAEAGEATPDEPGPAAATPAEAAEQAVFRPEETKEPAAQDEGEALALEAPLSGDSAGEPEGPKSEIDFEALWRTCPDVVGWIRIEGTVIDYPIVQGEDNLFYLKHLPDGTPNAAGSIMMDCANAPDFLDDVTILHGHHMKSGAMFGDIDEYKSEAYYQEHPMMRLYTPQGDYDVAIFAAYSVDGATFAYPTVFSGAEGFEEFLRRALSRSYITTDVEVAYGDRMVMLSTCAYAYENERFLVVGKILEE